MAAASNLFNSAISGFGFGKTSAENTETENNAEEKSDEKPGPTEEGNGSGFGAFSLSALSKAAADATMSIKDKVVSGNNMLAEFNKEQESFIKSNNKTGLVGVAPWVGYQGEDELKAKILSLSEDKRNFVRAPPSGVTFEFEYSSVSSTALALLQEDPRLEKMRYELVPKAVKEEEFWRNYFYRLNLIKQSFELKDFEQEEKQKKKKQNNSNVNNAKKHAANKKSEDLEDIGNDDDEFVSDSYQASTSDLAEADETMKKLGVAEDELEAELEGELNEYEVVDGKGQDGENPDWENQIQEMLDAESSDLK